MDLNRGFFGTWVLGIGIFILVKFHQSLLDSLVQSVKFKSHVLNPKVQSAEINFSFLRSAIDQWLKLLLPGAAGLSEKEFWVYEPEAWDDYLLQ